MAEHIFPRRHTDRQGENTLFEGPEGEKVPVLTLLVLAAPAAEVVSGGAGPDALQSKILLQQHEPTQRLRGRESSAEETGQSPVIKMVGN